jgi:hypothetical protein
MHFDTKSYLKSTRNHTAKHALNHINLPKNSRSSLKYIVYISFNSIIRNYSSIHVVINHEELP